MSSELQIAYDHSRTYTVTPLNTVGATTSTTLRTVTAYDDTNCKHVKKWGTDYAVSAISNAVIEHPRSAAGNAWTFDFQGWNGTAWVSMGTVADTGGASGAFAAGASFAATKIKIVVTPDAGDTISITDGDHITLTTSADAGGLSVMLSGESMTAAFTLYLSKSGATYYDTAYKYGGKRHTPDGTAKYPYFTPQTAYAALGGAFTIVTVLDSEHYVIDEWSVATASTTIQAALGQTPVFCSPIGASVYRDVIHDGNNSDTAYVASTGTDAAGGGTWWAPYATHQYAFDNIGARAYINTMDDETYIELITLSAACTMEPIYGKIPALAHEIGPNTAVTITHASINISGYSYTDIVGGGVGITLNVSNFSGIVSYVTFANAAAGINITNTVSGTIKSCYFNNVDFGVTAISNISGTIQNCYMSLCGSGIVINNVEFSGTIKNNISISNRSYGIQLVTGTLSGIVKNNSFILNGSYGIYTQITTQTGTIRENIFILNTTYDLYKPSGVGTITYSDYYTNSGMTIGAGVITTNPELCKTTLPYKNGISTLRRSLDGTNNPYHTGTGSNSMGIVTHGILLGANSITFNGVIFDGLDSYANAIYCLATRTGLNLKWCTFQNYIGIATDLYATAATSAVVSNCWFKDNGQALALPQGSNAISYCILDGNSKIGIWIDYTANTFNHCLFYGSEYGLYLDSNGNMTLKNTIINNNSTYGIYSEVSTAPAYICNTDPLNSYVDQSLATNLTDDPLLVDPDNNDFRIKIKEIGYDIESPCKESADDGYDMGAYLYSYSVLSDNWKKYQLQFNPLNMNDILQPKGGIEFEDASGNYSNWMKGMRSIFPLVWGENSATSERQMKMLRYLQSKIPSRESAYTADNCRMRLHLQKDSYYGTGSGTIDATVKTLTDSLATYYPIEKKGWHVSIVFESQAAAVVDATAKTITKAGAGWATNEWVGYYFYQNNMYFYILSNTATVLTVSDGNNYLTDSASFTAQIIKTFKILTNDETVLTLRDDDSELVSGTYSYFIDFVECRPKLEPFQAQQGIFSFTKWGTKSGIKLTLEEVD